MSLQQLSTETVDQYALKFRRLLRKVNGNNNALVPAILQVQMFLYGLVSVLIPLVATANPADLAAAIERARIVETGYNYVLSKETTNFRNTTQEVDELTKKIEQLSLNYTTLTSALTAQPARNTYQQSQRTRPQRSF